MSEITYISKEVSVEGTLDADDLKVVVAGSFSGNINASEVILEEGSRFDGEVDARIIVIEGELKGKVKSYQLKVSETARVDGELQTNSIEVASGAEIAGSISRVSQKILILYFTEISSAISTVSIQLLKKAMVSDLPCI